MLSKPCYVWLFKRSSHTSEITLKKDKLILRKYLLLRQMVSLQWLDETVVLLHSLKRKNGHLVMKFHCIVHHESLCAKIPNSNLARVIATTTKIVNFIVACSATTYRLFCSFDEMENAHRALPLHCTSSWLSCGKVLVKFGNVWMK